MLDWTLLMTVALSLVGIGWLIWKYWYIACWVVLGIWLDYSLVMGALRVWYDYIIIGGVA